MIHPSDKAFVNFLAPSSEGPWIAGGAVRIWMAGGSIEDHDIDVWFNNDRQLRVLWSKLLADSNMTKVYESDSAVTFKEYGTKKTIQLVKKQFYSSIHDVLAGFDFTCCQFGYDGEKFIADSQARYDAHHKVLRAVNLTPSIIPRLVKYVTYGYRPSKEILEYIQATKLETNYGAYHEYS